MEVLYEFYQSKYAHGTSLNERQLNCFKDENARNGWLYSCRHAGFFFSSKTNARTQKIKDYIDLDINALYKSEDEFTPTQTLISAIDFMRDYRFIVARAVPDGSSIFDMEDYRNDLLPLRFYNVVSSEMINETVLRCFVSENVVFKACWEYTRESSFFGRCCGAVTILNSDICKKFEIDGVQMVVPKSKGNIWFNGENETPLPDSLKPRSIVGFYSLSTGGIIAVGLPLTGQSVSEFSSMAQDFASILEINDVPVTPLGIYVLPIVPAYGSAFPVKFPNGMTKPFESVYTTVGNYTLTYAMNLKNPETKSVFCGTPTKMKLLKYAMSSKGQIVDDNGYAEFKVIIEIGISRNDINIMMYTQDGDIIDITDSFSCPVSYSEAAQYFNRNKLSIATQYLGTAATVGGAVASGNPLGVAYAGISLINQMASDMSKVNAPATIISNNANAYLTYSRGYGIGFYSVSNESDINNSLAFGYSVNMMIDTDIASFFDENNYYGFISISNAIFPYLPKQMSDELSSIFARGVFINYYV